MEWIAKLIFKRLLKAAMKLGAKGFAKLAARKHALLSRRWMWVHVWLPMITKLKESKNKYDDPLIPFIYNNQACFLEDGTARMSIGQIRQNIANGRQGDALEELLRLQNLLGLDDDL